MALGSVADWPGLYRKIRLHLVPGTGWFESVEIDFEPRCDDETLGPGKLREWWNVYIKSLYEAIGRRLHYEPATGDKLREAGFTDIQHVCYRIPLCKWSKNNRAEERAGEWWDTAMSPGVEGTGGFGLEAMSLAPLCKFSSWPREHVQRLCNEALEQSSDMSVHAYNNLHIWWARAPDDRNV